LTRILIVKLSSLGDIVHALPLAAALRRGFPDARLDWVVDERYQEILDLVPIVDRRIVWRTRSVPAWRSVGGVVAELRREQYDVVVDAQGLLKSAVLARLSGGGRVIGLPRSHLREPGARLFYTEVSQPGAVRHVAAINLSLASALSMESAAASWEFPLEVRSPTAVADLRCRFGREAGSFAVVNPGAAWPSKRWPAERFGALAARLREDHGLAVAVLWGPGEKALAEAVVAASQGAATATGSTSLGDLAAVLKEAALLVSGDTGPLHIGAALGTPIVGLYGPTDPERNGPWSPDDLTVSRFTECRCQRVRRCRDERWCLEEISVDAVAAAAASRLAATA
jgi:lipopolysaccharide heptosyltransferase I|tara:strand:- start:3946 stop:4965 length:1020 start_codon:yes stop_codon:yes gene_type:complete